MKRPKIELYQAESESPSAGGRGLKQRGIGVLTPHKIGRPPQEGVD